MSYEALMREQLPGSVYRLLRSIGRTGDRVACPVFAVGGFVRDLLIGQPNLDIDVVVEGDGIAFACALAEDEHGEARLHRRFGTAVVTLPAQAFGKSPGKIKVDVATARTETYEHPGALPSVRPGSIKEDLRRRDFTINAMAVQLNEARFGELVDFFGGKSDLESGYVRVLHDLSFVDDPTRILRTVRFEQRYGFSIEPHTKKLLEEAIAGRPFEGISGQRLRNEILLILGEADPVPAIRRMAHFHLVRYIHPSIRVSNGLLELFHRAREMLMWWESIPDSAHSEARVVTLNLIVLLDQLDASEAEEVSKRLALRKRRAEALMASKDRLPVILQHINGRNPPSAIYRMLKGIPLEVLLLAMAKKQRVRDSISLYLTQLRRIRPLVNGNDLRKLSYPEGPIYTQILDKTFAAQLDGLIVDRCQAIQFIQSQFKL